MSNGFTGETVPLPGDAGYGDATSDTQTTDELVPASNLRKLQSIKDAEIAQLRKESAANQARLQEIQQEQIVQAREAEIYTALRGQGYTHADAQEEATHAARYEVEGHFQALARDQELDTYKARDARVQVLAQQIQIQKEIREEFGLEPDEVDIVLKDLTGREPNYEALAWKLARSAERKKAETGSVAYNRQLRDTLPLPGAGMGARGAAEILNPPPGATPGTPAYEEYLTRKRAFLRQVNGR